MAEKLQQYQGLIGRLHSLRDSVCSRWNQYKESHPGTWKEKFRQLFYRTPAPEQAENITSIQSEIVRSKTRIELMRISAAVMGIEFSYAAETAFVSPILLEIGVEHKHMTLFWALSPIIGFFLTPILGSLSDKWKSPYGKRRPFILIMSIGVLFGLILVPNGEDLGYLLGDPGYVNKTYTPPEAGLQSTTLEKPYGNTYHPWGVFFTVLGIIFLDFDADACQSPTRAYLLDVTPSDDHARGLSTFTVMAGLGGFMGYALGGIDWDSTSIGDLFGGHVRAVFSLVTIIFIFCITATVTSFDEIPSVCSHKNDKSEMTEDPTEINENNILVQDVNNYGSVDQNRVINQEASSSQHDRIMTESTAEISLQQYLSSIIIMPTFMRKVCLTNLFCWMAHVCYSLYFTDFVGEAVFGGDPSAPIGSARRKAYEDGVRFGCWGMSMYSLSCACYSLITERLIKKYGARNVYVGGLCTYSIGMWLMYVIRAKAAVILFSWTAGVMYSTLFTMPYLLIAHYHLHDTWEPDGAVCPETRGLGTDVAVVSSCVFVAQLFVSLLAGKAVNMAGTTSAIVAIAATLAGVAAFCATRINYLDL